VLDLCSVLSPSSMWHGFTSVNGVEVSNPWPLAGHGDGMNELRAALGPCGVCKYSINSYPTSSISLVFT
jgi:hypothetical protein